MSNELDRVFDAAEARMQDSAKEQEAAAALSRSAQWAQHPSRDLFIECSVESYGEDLQDVSAKCRQALDSAKGDLAQRQQWARQARLELVDHAYHKLTDSAVAAFRKLLEPMDAKQLAQAYDDTSSDWQRLEIVSHAQGRNFPPSEYIPIEKKSIAFDDELMRREAQARRLPKDSLCRATLEREAGHLASLEHRMGKLDVIGADSELRRRFGFPPKPLSTVDDFDKGYLYAVEHGITERLKSRARKP